MSTPTRCYGDLYPDGCMAAHIAPVLHARKTGAEDSREWLAPCPSCDGHKTSLSLSIGNRGRRILWCCHGSAKCSQEAVYAALLDRKVHRSCIPFRKPSGKGSPNPREDSSSTREDSSSTREEREKLAEIERIILADDANPQRIRLLVGMALWDCGREEARQKLGISRATAYRAVSPVRQNPRS